MFTSARLKLTAWYVCFVMVITLMFSAVIFKVFSREVERFQRAQWFRTERRLLQADYPSVLPFPPPAELQFNQDTRNRMLLTLGIVNTGIWIMAALLGYLLAGRTLQPIRDMVEEQNRFVSDASHELKTPLTALKSTMEVYLRDKSPDLSQARTLIKESITEVDKLQSLSESLLRLAQFQQPGNNLKFTRVSLRSSIDEAIRKLKLLADAKKIGIDNQGSDIYFEAEKFTLVELWIILLDNAIKYSPIGSSVKILASKDDGFVTVSVVDQGIGIPAADIPRIFDRFYRADSARSRRQIGGYGLGLAIAKQIVTTHHGSVTVKSSEGKGAAFTIRLPLRQFSGKFQLPEAK